MMLVEMMETNGIHCISGNTDGVELQLKAGQEELAMELALSDYNTITPLSNLAPSQFPSKSLLLYGTLGHLYLGKSAHLARNTMSYSDGGLQIPVEERMELYTSLSSSYFAQFRQLGERLKAQLNVEDGWGSVASDYRQLPSW